MKRLIRSALVLAMIAGSGSALADGLILVPGDCDTAMPGGNCWTIAENRNPSDEEINALLGTADMITLYKAEVGDEDHPATVEEGAFADEYDSIFSNLTFDPEDAWTFWTGTFSIDCTDGCYVLVKDGNANPSVYIFEISDWNGTDDTSPAHGYGKRWTETF